MPLKSIRVLDLSRLLPGPHCTMMLADFGAEVIKVEHPELGDYIRDFHPKLNEDSAMFHSLNRNKKSVTLDLKSNTGKEQFLQLVKTADVLVESFRPGVMKKLGLDYEELKQMNPGLIYCAITGYGQDGPYADKPGHDINYLSYSGLLNLMGQKNLKPMIPAAQIADIGGGSLPAVIGILLALFERQRTGEGQLVDVSMLDGVMSWLHMSLPNHFVGQEQRRGQDLLTGGYACYQVYETKDNRYLAMGGIEEKFWREFCEGIGRKEFIPLLHAPLDEQQRLINEIQEIMLEKNLEEWMEVFFEREACVSPVNTFDEAVADPQVVARDMIQTINDSASGEQKQIGIPIKLSQTPGQIRTRAPRLGEHNSVYFKIRINEVEE